MEPISDERLREVCDKLHLFPVGMVPVGGYDTDLDLEEADAWDGDPCWSLAYAVVSGTTYPDAGPLGFAAGYPSPGWQYLRNLVDEIHQSIVCGASAYSTPAALSTSIFIEAQYRAGSMNWRDAMVCVADLGWPTESEQVEHYPRIFGITTIGDIAIAVLSSMGRRVCIEIFGEQLNPK